MNYRIVLTIAVLAISLSACSVIGAKPSPSADPTSSAVPSPIPSATAPATTSPAPTNTPDATGSPKGGLDGREFVSVLVTENGESKVLVSGTKIRVSFSDGAISATAGCNHLGGKYQYEAGKLVVGEMATTEMGCQSTLMEQDQWLADFLGSKPEVALDGNNLILTSGTTELTLLDREQAEPDQPLSGITWGLNTIIDGDAASSVPVGATATLLFNDDGTVQIEFGCNAGGGNYAVGDGTIHFDQIISTKMACVGAKGDVEAAVVAVLNADNIKFSIDHSTLTLQAGPHGLQYDAALDVTTTH